MRYTEHELKILLSKEQYNQILSLFQWEKFKRQVNFYYDCKNVLNDDKKSTIRVRKCQEELLLQVKIPHEEDKGAVHVHDEYEKEISILPYSIKSKELNELCSRKDMEDVFLIGMLITDRYIDASIPGLEIALDSSSYLGKIDYELELEYQDKIPLNILEKLSFLNIDFDVRTKGKYSRFVERYLAIQTEENMKENGDFMLSVIIPIFNTEKYLQRCIDSVLNQTYSKIEVILIDDGSTDLSGEICDSYAAVDKRIKVFHQENKGVSIARNYGIGNASGDYILFVDSDDWLEPDMLEIMVSKINRAKYQLIACNAFRDNDPTKKIMDEEIEQDEILNFEELGRCDKRGTSVMNGPWGKLYDLRLIKENGLKFDEQISFGEDKLFVFSYSKLAEETVCIAKPYYHYFCREDSVMNEELSEKHFQMFQVYKILLSSFDEKSERYEIIRQACLRLVVWFRNKCTDKKEPFWGRLNKIETSLIKERKLPELKWEEKNESRTN